MRKLLFITLIALGLTACQKEPPITPDRLEEARSTAKANAEMNAQLYRAMNARQLTRI